MPKSKAEKVNKNLLSKRDNAKTQEVEEIPRKLWKTRQGLVARQSRDSRRSRSRTLLPELNQDQANDHEIQKNISTKARPLVESKVTIPKAPGKDRNEGSLQHDLFVPTDPKRDYRRVIQQNKGNSNIAQENDIHDQLGDNVRIDLNVPEDEFNSEPEFEEAQNDYQSDSDIDESVESASIKGSEITFKDPGTVTQFNQIEELLNNPNALDRHPTLKKWVQDVVEVKLQEASTSGLNKNPTNEDGQSKQNTQEENTNNSRRHFMPTKSSHQESFNKSPVVKSPSDTTIYAPGLKRQLM